MRLSVLWRFFSFPVCVQQRKLPPPTLTSPTPTTATVKLASDWLGVGLELGASPTGPQLRQETRGLISGYSVNMAGSNQPP
jgi:hypothetical protein